MQFVYDAGQGATHMTDGDGFRSADNTWSLSTLDGVGMYARMKAGGSGWCDGILFIRVSQGGNGSGIFDGPGSMAHFGLSLEPGAQFRFYDQYTGVWKEWPSHIIDVTQYHDYFLSTLVSTFRSDFNGVVEYDPNVWATSNVASTVAGVENLVAIRKDTSPGSLYYQSVMTGPQLPVVRSLVGVFTGTGTIPGTGRASTGSKKCDAHIWAKINYLDTGLCDPQKLAYWLDSYWLQNPFQIDPPENDLLDHDYVVAKKGFVFDLSPWGDERPIDDPSQPLGTDLATSYNAYMDAAFEMANASLHSQLPLPDRLIQNPKPAADEMRRRGYIDAAGRVAPLNFIYFYLGDYDSSSWMETRVPGLWEDSTRGQTPMGWAFNPNLTDAVATAAGYINPTNLCPTRNPSGLPSGAAAWAAHCEPYYRRVDESITGFLMNGVCGQLNPTTELVYRPFSGDGVMTQAFWMHTGNHLEQNVPVASQVGDLSGSAQQMADTVHAQGVQGATNFISFRTVLQSPSTIKSVADKLRSQHPDMGYESVVTAGTLTYFYLLRRSLGGNNDKRATYAFDTIPDFAQAGSVIHAQIGVRNDGWDTWYAAGGSPTVLAVSTLVRRRKRGCGGRAAPARYPFGRRRSDIVSVGDPARRDVQADVPDANGGHRLVRGRSAPDGTWVALTGLVVTAGTPQLEGRVPAGTSRDGTGAGESALIPTNGWISARS